MTANALDKWYNPNMSTPTQTTVIRTIEQPPRSTTDIARDMLKREINELIWYIRQYYEATSTKNRLARIVKDAIQMKKDRISFVHLRGEEQRIALKRIAKCAGLREKGCWKYSKKELQNQIDELWSMIEDRGKVTAIA